MQTVTLTPLFRNSIGFDRFNDLFEAAFNHGAASETNTYPPYNIEKRSENQYRITMAVAGFKPDELDVVVQDGELTISGQVQDRTGDVEYLHKGIAARAFQRKFSLTDYMKVEGANIADGLLQIDLEREVPEARKPKNIEIKTDVPLEAKAITDANASSKELA
jgi:molecular chaperone IbpA